MVELRCDFSAVLKTQILVSSFIVLGNLFHSCDALKKTDFCKKLVLGRVTIKFVFKANRVK